MAPAHPKHKKRIGCVSNQDRVLVALCKSGVKALGKFSIVQQAKAHSKRAGEQLAEKRADDGLYKEIDNLMNSKVLEWNDDTQEVLVPARTRELLGDIVGDGADDDSREAYIAISAKIRKVFPHSKPRTKAQCIKDLVTLRWRFQTKEQENEERRAAQDAHIARLCALVRTLLRKSALPPTAPTSTAAAKLLDAPATPSSSSRPVVTFGASPLRRAYTSPAVLKCEDFDVPITPANVRAPFLQRSFAPLTPVSNPRPPRLMDAIREEPESPTRPRQGPAHRNVFRVDQDDDDMMDEDEAMDEDEDGDVRQSPSFIEKGKDALRRLADAVSGGVAAPMHLLGGRASPPVQVPPTPDMTPVFARIAARGVPQRSLRERSPSPLDMDVAGGSEPAEDPRDAQIRALRDEVAQLKERLRAAQRAATDKDASIVELQGRLAEKEAVLAGLVKGFLPVLPALAEAAKHVPDAGGLVVHI